MWNVLGGRPHPRRTPFPFISLLAPERTRMLLLLLLYILSSAASVGLFLFRVYYAQTTTYRFLNKNLLLAWIPMVCALLAWRLGYGRRRPSWLVWGLLGLWLLFFPNAPYLITDLMHISPRHRVPLWFDALLLFSYAWTGLMLGFFSLQLVQLLFQRWYGPMLGWLVALVSIAAGSFGVYLGRLPRWNSWDVLLAPHSLLTDILAHFHAPLNHLQGLLMSFFFFVFLTVTYVTVAVLGGIRWQREG
ncbi:DUF1361 domain-containing protein [Litorilinea aerophila]|nr:DUF1361 domain-containing protein [Litorilinea aerophila]MCC9078364.1 DUF1361 domain-containing protein [Litorilinea aerophila]GIV78555.1 MAG: hypothetical protein KatS3mg050_2949 [Litorilinea sp.]